MTVMKLSEVVTALGGSDSLTRDRLKALILSLGQSGIGVEPDVLGGAKTPKAEDSVVLFRLVSDEGA